MANDDGFLSRWARRKTDVLEGRALDEPSQPAVKVAAPVTATPVVHAPAPEVAHAQPAPTLADVQQLTPDSDFTGFMAEGVATDVKNAAMKKLFADPHFNVMDRMDIYIDDYTQADPLPMAMLRQMTSAKTLNLFDDASEKTTSVSESDKPAIEQRQVVAQSVPADNHSNREPHTHDHADLRLQPDPTPRPEGAEPKPV